MLETCFAPAERTDRATFERQLARVGASSLMSTLLRSVGGVLAVLNEDRQIVALNHAFLEAIGVADPAQVLGLRLGESLRCVHAGGEPHGCGTTPACASCGAVIAMMTAIRENRADERICALTAEVDGALRDTSLLVKAVPMEHGGQRWILVYAQDVTQQQFWAGLERVFFHDVGNLLTAALGTGELLALRMPADPDVRTLVRAIERLANEVTVQRSLIQLQGGELPVAFRRVSLSEIRRELEVLLFGHPAARNKVVRGADGVEDVEIETDLLLASRVLANMLLNALEATPEGGTVGLTTAVGPDSVAWSVWNAGAIEREVQRRIFQRHFSTKASFGRGLGTYSMKLFGERYLGGAVAFASNPEEGTTFTLRLPRTAPTAAR